MTAKKALPLSAGLKPSGTCPTDCPNYQEGHCADHKEMESSRSMGLAFFKFAGWSIPLGLLVLAGILSVINSRVDSVEGKITEHLDSSTEKLNAIHHSVMTIEFNMRNDYSTRGKEFTDLKFKEDY